MQFQSVRSKLQPPLHISKMSLEEKMRTNKVMIGAALGAALLMAPGTASAGFKAHTDCFQPIADAIKAKMAHLDAKIDQMHAMKHQKHHAVAAPAPAPKKAAPMKKAEAPKPKK
jgi:outer membrane murein-binding lipoprotein Lpp